VVAFNLPALMIVAVVSTILILGIRESARANAILVVFKVALVALFVGVGAFFIKPANYVPFAPNGFAGVWAGASLAFFSYIGFDAVSTAAEETRDPQRNLPRGIIISLIVCTILYVATAVVMTGMVPARELATGDPLAHALRSAGLGHLATFMALGAVVAVTAVLLVFQLGQARIFMVMSRDGLMPPMFARVHKRFRTPATATMVVGTFVGIAPSLITPSQALELTSIGTLFAFVIVSAGVIALRIQDPHRPRPFRCPGYPVTPLLSIAFCVWLMAGLPRMNWARFGAWLLVGIVIYAAYGRRKSRLQNAA
jgi:APA family basic amino acid/polyamine antiporter